MSLFKRKKGNQQALELPKTIDDKATETFALHAAKLTDCSGRPAGCQGKGSGSASPHAIAEQAEKQIEQHWERPTLQRSTNVSLFIQAGTLSAASNPLLSPWFCK